MLNEISRNPVQTMKHNLRIKFDIMCLPIVHTFCYLKLIFGLLGLILKVYLICKHTWSIPIKK
jgi:hypothetical protein